MPICSNPRNARLLTEWIPASVVVALIAFHSPFSAAASTPASDAAVATQTAPTAIGPYSQAIRAGDTLYVSGQLPIDPTTGKLPADNSIEAQTRQTLDNIKSILAADGLNMSDVVSTTVYLTDLDEFGKMNEVYGHYFSAAYPARVTVGVAALPKGAHIEIASVAKRHD